MKDAYRNVPRAIITAVAICTILYVFTGLVAVGVVGSSTLSSAGFRDAPLANAMLSTGFKSAFFVVAVGAVTATASVLLIQMLGLSRTVYAMSVNNQVPSFLSAVHPRFKTPYRAEILIGAAMAVAALLVDSKSVIALTSLGILSYYALINLASIRLRGQKGAFKVHYSVSVLGFVAARLCLSTIWPHTWSEAGEARGCMASPPWGDVSSERILSENDMRTCPLGRTEKQPEIL